MTICKELPGKTLSSGHNRTLLVTFCLSLFLHFIIISPFVFILTEKATILIKDVPIEVTIAPAEPAPVEVASQPAPAPAPLPVPVPVPPPPPEAVAPKPLPETKNVTPAPTPIPIAEQKPAKLPAPAPKKPVKKKTKPSPVPRTAQHTPDSNPTPVQPEAIPQEAVRAATPPPSNVSYEQIVSLWFKRHRLYNDLGNADVLLRIRLHKNGTVTSYYFEKSTGDENLDTQIINSLKNASPFPPIPASYSSAEEEEFLLPINTPTTQE